MLQFHKLLFSFFSPEQCVSALKLHWLRSLDETLGPVNSFKREVIHYKK